MTRVDSSHAPVPILTSIASLTETADAWICDIWGVLHNGLAAFPDAAEACRRFRSRGGAVVLVSNAPRPNASVARQLARMGVGADCFDAMVTSGDVTRALLADWQRRPLFHLGPDRDKGVFDDLDITFAPVEQAEVVALTGLFDDSRETPGDYAEMFKGLLARNATMICANPDLVVERGADIVYCAGALAELYESLGGPVVYAGKPHLPVYGTARALIDRALGRPTPPERILAIGDGLRTDMDGARAAGLRPVFVGSAVHLGAGQALDAAAIERLFADRPYRPVAAMAGLAW
jgi:HAD superfamily hydrolase (TIGR01459 family)